MKFSNLFLSVWKFFTALSGIVFLFLIIYIGLSYNTQQKQIQTAEVPKKISGIIKNVQIISGSAGMYTVVYFWRDNRKKSRMIVFINIKPDIIWEIGDYVEIEYTEKKNVSQWNNGRGPIKTDGLEIINVKFFDNSITPEKPEKE